ncbi:tRNA (guanosine(37)-N1)-methyltransferase TrmD [Candidatus Parcubacteria bacterium]|nr:tRNA (guanosine(37)-N1)-methyltransferase TrmD [Candidatus Parcubacteria bacterium]
MMRIDILTLFPDMFRGPFDESIIKRAQDNGLVEIKIHNLRDWSEDSYGTVDDKPYGGGVGMIMRVDIIDRAISKLKAQSFDKLRIDPERSRTGQSSKVILLTPQGKVFNQKVAGQLVEQKHLILICGHYEGVDERVREHLVDEEISIGDYILTGGELPAMVITDSIVRLLPGVLKKEEAVKNESLSELKGKILLECPQYTRPEVYQDWKVPEILLSGDHGEIEKWRREKALEKTKKRRPDLLGGGEVKR